MLKLGVTGTREGMTIWQHQKVNNLFSGLDYFDDVELHHGDCKGADEEAFQIAKRLGFRTVAHPPIDTKLRAYTLSDIILPARDYEDRNRMIVSMADSILVIPKTAKQELRSGTWQTYRFAKEANKLWKIVLPNGVALDA